MVAKIRIFDRLPLGKKRIVFKNLKEADEPFSYALNFAFKIEKVNIVYDNGNIAPACGR
jgi:hypothetical protein